MPLLWAFLGMCVGIVLNIIVSALSPNGDSFPLCHDCEIPAISLITNINKHNKKDKAKYLSVILLTALLFFTAALRFDTLTALLPASFLISILLIVTIIDLEFMIIPHRVTIPAIIAASCWQVFLLKMPPLEVLASVGFSYILLAPFVFFNLIGGGDAMLCAFFGAFFGLKKTVSLLIIATMLGGIVSTVLLLSGKVDRKAKIPFGPFLTLAALVMLFYGNFILSIYGLD